MNENVDKALVAEAYAGKVAHTLLDAGAVRFDFKDGFTFSSGIESSVYFDGSALASHPKAWRSVLKALAVHARSADVVVGVATSAIVHSAALASMLQKPHAFVRKDTKEHGAKGNVAGASVENKNVIVIEDTVTTGKSLASAVDALREAGAGHISCTAVNTYDFRVARDTLIERGVSLHALTSMHAIARAARARGIISKKEFKQLHAWLASVCR